jgi:hypothetical protein
MKYNNFCISMFLGKLFIAKLKCRDVQNFMQMVMQRGFTWRGSHDNLFGFAKSVTAGLLAKESWLQRLHVKPSIARIRIEFLCNIYAI